MSVPHYRQSKLFTSLLMLILLGVSSGAVASLGQSAAWPLEARKGSFVVLKIPARLVGFEKVSFWSGTSSYGAVVEQGADGGLLVGGVGDWRTAGWPLMRQLTLEKVSRNSRFTEVELRDPLFNVKLRFDSGIKDLNSAFRETVFTGLVSEFEASDFYKKEVIGKVLPQIYKGRLAGIPEAAKLRLLKDVNYIDTAIRAEKYKGDTYLVVNAGGDVQIYNTIQMSQSARVAHAVNERVLRYIKYAARAVKYHPDVDGIKVELYLPFKNFVTEDYLPPHYDFIELYAPMDVIRQFAEDELTNQEFVEEAILLVNGNRTRIPTLESR